MFKLTICVLALAFVPAFLWTVNMFSFHDPAAGEIEAPADVPPFSVLIPARNEEDRIDQTLESLRTAPHERMEFLVYDDQSEDDTAERVRSHAREDDRVRLLKGKALPDNWNGKQHACWQLSRAAKHDRLCFLDADVRLDGTRLPAVLRAFENDESLRLLSGFPHQETRTIGEKLLISFINYILLGFLPIWLMRRTTWSAFAAGCGQIMITDREAYEQVDGHRAIRQSRHDGITLPAAYRRCGFRTDLFDAGSVARVRMYNGFRKTWNGIAKNATEGIAQPFALPVFTVFLLGGQVGPFLLLPWALITGGTSSIAVPASAGAICLAYLPRIWGVLRFDQSVIGAVLHPVGVVLLLCNQWFAFLRAIAGGGVSWKGRSYDDG